MKDLSLDSDRELQSQATERMTNIMKKFYSPRNFAAPPELEQELNYKAAQRSGGSLTERGFLTSRATTSENQFGVSGNVNS